MKYRSVAHRNSEAAMETQDHLILLSKCYRTIIYRVETVELSQIHNATNITQENKKGLKSPSRVGVREVAQIAQTDNAGVWKGGIQKKHMQTINQALAAQMQGCDIRRVRRTFR